MIQSPVRQHVSRCFPHWLSNALVLHAIFGNSEQHVFLRFCLLADCVSYKLLRV